VIPSAREDTGCVLVQFSGIGFFPVVNERPCLKGVRLIVVSAMFQMLERVDRCRPCPLIFEALLSPFKAEVVNATPPVNPRSEVSHRKLNHRVEFRDVGLAVFTHVPIISDSDNLRDVMDIPMEPIWVAPQAGDAPISCQALFVRTADRTVMSHSGEDMLLSGHAFTER
jgi:hypothetical protein